MRSIPNRIATTTFAAVAMLMAVAAMTTDSAAASPVHPAALVNCAANGITTPCFEKIWSDGNQVKMTFVDMNPAPSNGPVRNFYVLAPQIHTPQGTVPFLHDHVISNVGNDSGLVRYHAYFVLCSAEGLSSGGCVASMTSIPGLGTIPFAKAVNGQKLTSAAPIESPANSGLLTILDTGGEILATIADQ